MAFKKLYFIYIYIFGKILKISEYSIKIWEKYRKYGSGGRPAKRIFPV